MIDNIQDWWYTLGTIPKLIIKVLPVLIIVLVLVMTLFGGKKIDDPSINDGDNTQTTDLTQEYTERQPFESFESPNQTTGEPLNYDNRQSTVQLGQIDDGLYIAGIGYSDLDRQSLREAGVVMYNYGSLEDRREDIGLERTAPLVLIKGGQVYEFQEPNAEEVLAHFNE